MVLTSHQLGKFAPGIRFFRFSYVQPKQIRNHIIIYWIEAFYEIGFAIQKPITSLVRGQAKRNTAFAENDKNVDNPPPRLNRGAGIDIMPRD